MAKAVTDPNLIRQLREAAGLPPQPEGTQTPPPTGGRIVTDPAIMQGLKNRARLLDAAKKRASTGVQSGVWGEEPEPPAEGPTMEGSRVTRAFDAAADPRASQPFPVPEPAQYGFTQNLISRLPFGDEYSIAGGTIGRYGLGKLGVRPDISLKEADTRSRFMEHAAQDKYRAENPWGDVGGMALGITVGGPTGAARAFGIRGAPAAAAIPATAGGRALEGIRSGAPIGALYGAGEGEGLKERAVNAATGAAVGAGVGAALPYLGAAARSARRLRGGYDPAIGGHVQRLEQESDNFYTQMDNAGVQLRPAAFNRILTNLQVRARNAGIDNELHPAATAIGRALQRDIHDLTRAPTLRRMDQIRRKIRDAVPKNASDDERRIIRTMVEGMDENLNRLTPRDLTGGNPRAGMTALREGRRLRQQFYKAETIDEILGNARDKVGANYTQAGLQTAMRQEFRALNKRIRKGQEPGWSNEERRIINLIVRGGAGENFGRLVGRLAVRGPVSASIPALTGYFVNPALGVGMAAGGELAKRTSTARGIMNVEALDRLIGTGTAQAPQRQLGPVSRGLGQARRLTTMLGLGLGDRLLTGER